MTHALFSKKEDIISWLNLCNIEPDTYTLRRHFKYGFVVDMEGDCNLSNKKLDEIKVKFGVIKKDFKIENNNLTSLYGCPDSVHSFNCIKNKLTSLEYCPATISGSLLCQRNQISCLLGMPEVIPNIFNCSFNELKSLEYGPKRVGYIDCSVNKIANLYHSPEYIRTHFICEQNLLTDFEGLDIDKIHGDFIFSNNKLTSLKHCPDQILGTFDISYNQLTSLKHGPYNVIDDYCASDNKIQSWGYFPSSVLGRIYLSGNPGAGELALVYKMTDIVPIIFPQVEKQRLDDKISSSVVDSKINKI